MIKVHIKIDKQLATRGWRKAFGFKTLWETAVGFAAAVIIIWVALFMTNSITGQGQFTTYDFAALALLGLAATVATHIKWYLDLGKNSQGWEFEATLDDQGVKTHAIVETDRDVPWSFYKGYREYDGYIEIHDENNQVTFIPKTEELMDAVAFTKENIRRL